MTQQAPDVDVLIAGGGPAGLALGIDLLRRGVRVRLVEAAERAFAGSRAKGVQPRTQEVLEDLGALDALTRHATAYPPLGLHLGPLTVPWRMIRRHRPTSDVPHPNTLLVAQYDTDGVLRERFTELGGTVEFGSRLVGFTDDGERVESTVGTRTVSSRYLVGADGGSSAVRKLAGIGFTGTTDEADHMIIADVVVDGPSRGRWHVWPRRGRFLGLCPLPDGTRFQLMLRLPAADGSRAMTDDEMDQRMRAALGAAGLTLGRVDWRSVFRPNVRLADRYRQGNVFLVGDAAHVHTPAGAQGLNTGVQDSYNLGWKLGEVLGGAPDALLDTYEAERRPVAARVLGLSSALYAELDHGRRLRAATRGDEERQLALSYRGGPLAPRPEGLRAGPVAAGDRAPDAPLAGGGRLFERFRGPHFTLVAVGDPAVEAARTAPPLPVHAGVETVSVATADAGPVTRAYGLTGPAWIVVRPDGYVAAVVAAPWTDVRLAPAMTVREGAS
jgi:2-polyprenyl-6-methoxyphenol hydroxylase-like FAD-dependent oxidoreductase